MAFCYWETRSNLSRNTKIVYRIVLMFSLQYNSHCADFHKTYVPSETFYKMLPYQFHKMQQMVYSLTRGHAQTHGQTCSHHRALLSNFMKAWNRHMEKKSVCFIVTWTFILKKIIKLFIIAIEDVLLYLNSNVKQNVLMLPSKYKCINLYTVVVFGW